MKQKNSSSLIAIILFLYSFVCCNVIYNKSDLQNLNWLEGNWQGEKNGTTFYEKWEMINDSCIAGINYFICNGNIEINDSSFIRLRNGKIIYESGKSLWNLTSFGNKTCRFENDNYDEIIDLKIEKNNILKTKLTFPKKNSAYSLIAIDKNQISNKLKHQYISQSYDGYYLLNGDKKFISLTFDSLNSLQNAYLTSNDHYLIDKKANFCCFNNPKINLIFNDTKTKIQLSLTNNDIILQGKILIKKELDVILYRRNNQNHENNIFSQNDIKIPTENGFLNGKIFLPKKNKKNHFVIFISDDSFDQYEGLATTFVSQGIGILLFNSKNKYIETDWIAINKFIKSTPELKSDKIGIFSINDIFNKGLTIASNNKEVGFLVLISNDLISTKEKILNECTEKLKANSFPKQTIVAATDVWNALFLYVGNPINITEIDKMLEKAYQEGWGQVCLPERAPTKQEISNSIYWTNIDKDFSNNLSALQIPLLAIYGERDLNLNVKKNAELIDSIFNNKKRLCSIRVYGNADHHLKTLTEQNTFWPTYANDFLNQTIDWILEK